MKFLPAEDDNINQLYQRIVSEDGKIEIAVHPVMFGYRVRAGYVGDSYVHLDWCGGSDHSAVEMLYSIAKNILEAKGDFKGVPSHSIIKPYYKDVDFMRDVMKLTTEPLEVVKLKPLGECRINQLKDLLNL